MVRSEEFDVPTRSLTLVMWLAIGGAVMAVMAIRQLPEPEPSVEPNLIAQAPTPVGDAHLPLP